MQLAKFHNGAIALGEYAACLGELRMARFGRDGAWRTPVDAGPFQPIRELIERALIEYDWGKAFTVLNLVIKPYLDRLLNEELAGALAAANGDTMLREIHFSLNEDALWHREWAGELARVAIADTPANADQFATWIDEWRPRAVAAVEGFAPVFERAPVSVDANAVIARITAAAEDDAKAALATPVG